MHKLASIIAFLALLVSPTMAAAYTTVVGAKITKLAARTGNYTVPSGTKAFFVEINGTYTNTCSGGPSPTAYYGIDQTIPSAAIGDNVAQYRDHVSSAQAAFMLDKTVTLYIDGCVGGFARIVGIDVY